MNYDSVEELLAAGTLNMEQLRSSNKNDDGTDTRAGPEWFGYDGSACSVLYASGNSWHGLGSNAEQLRVDRRDAAMWDWWSESGTLYRFYRFFKFRWGGYSQYNSTGDAYRLVYDVVLFETGDILLAMVEIPTAAYDGTFALGSIAFAKPTVQSPYVTFYAGEGGYTVAYELANIQRPYDRKYLVQDGSSLYTVADGALQLLDAAAPSAEVFAAYGKDELPPGALLVGLTAPKVLYWFDDALDEPSISATVTAVPTAKTVEVSADVSNPIFVGIYGMAADATPTVGVQYSTDNKASWSAEQTIPEFLTIDKAALWAELAATHTLWLRFILHNAEEVLTDFTISCAS